MSVHTHTCAHTHAHTPDSYWFSKTPPLGASLTQCHPRRVLLPLQRRAPSSLPLFPPQLPLRDPSAGHDWPLQGQPPTHVAPRPPSLCPLPLAAWTEAWTGRAIRKQRLTQAQRDSVGPLSHRLPLLRWAEAGVDSEGPQPGRRWAGSVLQTTTAQGAQRSKNSIPLHLFYSQSPFL